MPNRPRKILNIGAFLSPHPHPDRFCAPSARPAPVSSSNEAAAEPSFATPHKQSPCRLWPIQGPTAEPLLRRTQRPSRAPPNCVEADDGAAAGDAAGKLARYCRAPTCSGAAEPRCARAAAPGRAGSRAAGPRHPHLSRGATSSQPLPLQPPSPSSGRPFLGPGPGVGSPDQRLIPGQEPGLGLRRTGRRLRGLRRGLGPQSPDPSVPPASRGGGAESGAERTDLEVQRHLPGRRRRSAPRAPEGRGSVGGRHRSPSRPRGPCAARSSLQPRECGARSSGRGGAGGAGRGRRGGAGRARAGGPDGAGTGGRNLAPPPPPRSRSNGRCLGWVVMSDLCLWTQRPPAQLPAEGPTHLPQTLFEPYLLERIYYLRLRTPPHFHKL